MWESKAGSLGWQRKLKAPKSAVAGNPQPPPLSQSPRCTGVMPGAGDGDSSLQSLGVRGRKWLPSGEDRQGRPHSSSIFTRAREFRSLGGRETFSVNFYSKDTSAQKDSPPGLGVGGSRKPFRG